MCSLYHNDVAKTITIRPSQFTARYWRHMEPLDQTVLLPKIMTVPEVARYMRLSAASIHTMLLRNPAALPPRLNIPGRKHVLWLAESVVAWVREHEEAHSSNPKPAPPLVTAIAVNPSGVRGGRRMQRRAAMRRRRAEARPRGNASNV